MNDVKEKSSIDSALKHHSSAQAAIKLLQDQLECLDQIRKTTNDSYNWFEESDIDRSTSNFLSATSNCLLDLDDNISSPILTSTLKKHSKIKDDTVIRNLLPTFEGMKKKRDSSGHHHKISPVKPSRHHPSHHAQTTKDSLASTTLSLSSTPVSTSTYEPALGGSDAIKSVYEKHFTGFREITDNLNISEIVARLAKSSFLNESDVTKRSLDSTGSDELCGLLEKIAQTGQQLKIELQSARQRELELVKQIQNMQSGKNGLLVTPQGTHKGTSPKDASAAATDHRHKQRKLEDALLSLQDENLKLNRLLKGKGLTPPAAPENSEKTNKDLKKALAVSESENKVLIARVKRMVAQLSYYEKKLNDRKDTTEDSGLPVKDQPIASTNASQTKQTESEVRLEEKIKKLEDELHLALSGMGDTNGLQLRINDLHRTLLEKDNRIKRCEVDLDKAIQKNTELLEKYEDLQKNDIYKRKEVLQLCEKFEKMKSRYKKLETEIYSVREREQKDTTKEWALQDSLRKLFRENESLQKKLLTEQRELTMSKVLLQKDYDLLKHRYDNLILKLNGGSDTEVERNSPILKGDSDYEEKPSTKTHLVSKLPKPQVFSSYRTPEPRLLPDDPLGKNLRPKSAAETSNTPLLYMDDSSKSLRPQSALQRHKRSHTSPVYAAEVPSKLTNSVCGLRVRSDPDIDSRKIPSTAARASSKRSISPVAKKSIGRYTTAPNTRGSSNGYRSKLLTPHCSGCSLNNSPMYNKANEIRKAFVVSKNRELNDGLEKISPPYRSASLSRLVFQQKRSSAYDEEYIRNVKGPHAFDCPNSSMLKIADDNSFQQKSNVRSSLRSKSEILSAHHGPTHRRRMHTAPESVLTNIFTGRNGLRYGESDYAREYLSNMDGVKLVVNLSHSNSANEIPQTKESTPVKSILKSSTSSASGNSLKSNPEVASSDRERKAPSDWPKSSLASVKRPILAATFSSSVNDTKSASLSQNDSAPNSRASEKSFHLSDLPCDQSNVYDKFRNFDEYKRTTTTASVKSDDPVVPEKEELVPDDTIANVKCIAPPEASYSLSKTRFPDQSRERKDKKPDDDGDSVGQSSVSTTGDHMGRIEFLRDVRIKTGLLMSDLIREEDPKSQNFDSSGEIKVGLSDNQEAYADKLIKKYTKNAKKILEEV